METKTGRSTRDRAATTARILDAVENILIRDGFAALGINSIAREAGVDKVLIYRYFGGMADLIRQFVLARDVWPQAGEFLPAGMEAEKFAGRPVAERFTETLAQGEKLLRKRPLSLALLSWETAAPGGPGPEFTRQREQQTTELARRVCAGASSTLDAEAVFALLWAGMIQFTLMGRARSPLAGIRAQKKTERRRIENAVRKVAQKVLKEKKKKKARRRDTNTK